MQPMHLRHARFPSNHDFKIIFALKCINKDTNPDNTNKLLTQHIADHCCQLLAWHTLPPSAVIGAAVTTVALSIHWQHSPRLHHTAACLCPPSCTDSRRPPPACSGRGGTVDHIGSGVGAV